MSFWSAKIPTEKILIKMQITLPQMEESERFTARWGVFNEFLSPLGKAKKYSNQRCMRADVRLDNFQLLSRIVFEREIKVGTLYELDTSLTYQQN